MGVRGRFEYKYWNFLESSLRYLDAAWKAGRCGGTQVCCLIRLFEMAKSKSKVRWCGWRREYVSIVDVRQDVGIPICNGMRGGNGKGMECVA
jgi:hypothetical protein